MAGILIIAHAPLATALKDCIAHIYGGVPARVGVIDILPDCDPVKMIAFAEAEVGRLREENGVLVLTDMYGATPANIACRLASLPNVRVLAGVNLPMLVRSVCYRTCPIDQLVEKALMGAAKGVHMIAAPASPGELLAPTGSACLPANSPAGSGVGMPASASVVASRADEGPAR